MLVDWEAANLSTNIAASRWTSIPRRGQFVVYDRDSSHLVRRILLPIPTKQTKGMLVTPTVFGNLLAGSNRRGFAS